MKPGARRSTVGIKVIRSRGQGAAVSRRCTISARDVPNNERVGTHYDAYNSMPQDWFLRIK